jgi:hypothetical protein
MKSNLLLRLLLGLGVLTAMLCSCRGAGGTIGPYARLAFPPAQADAWGVVFAPEATP